MGSTAAAHASSSNAALSFGIGSTDRSTFGAVGEIGDGCAKRCGGVECAAAMVGVEQAPAVVRGQESIGTKARGRKMKKSKIQDETRVRLNALGNRMGRQGTHGAGAGTRWQRCECVCSNAFVSAVAVFLIIGTVLRRPAAKPKPMKPPAPAETELPCRNGSTALAAPAKVATAHEIESATKSAE